VRTYRVDLYLVATFRTDRLLRYKPTLSITVSPVMNDDELSESYRVSEWVRDVRSSIETHHLDRISAKIEQSLIVRPKSKPNTPVLPDPEG